LIADYSKNRGASARGRRAMYQRQTSGIGGKKRTDWKRSKGEFWSSYIFSPEKTIGKILVRVRPNVSIEKEVQRGRRGKGKSHL